MLNDLHINISQAILKNQFPEVDGLISTLLQAKKTIKLQIRCGLQIVHCRGNHWILASNMNCKEGTLQVFDSLYASVDEGTFSILKGLFLVHETKNDAFSEAKKCFRLWVIFYCHSNSNIVWPRSSMVLFQTTQDAEPFTELY